MSLLEIKNLVKSYDDKVVLNNISLNLDINNIVTIIGPSGEGKTTLFKVINMLTPYDRGEIIVDGLLMNESTKINKEIQNKIGLVFQNYNLFPHLTVLENLNLAQIKREKKTKEEATKKSIEYLEKFDILDKKDFYPETLSGGECQRVAIARALCLEPKIICFDEPTAALDPIHTKEVAELIKSIKSPETLIIVVTHDTILLKEISDQVIFLKQANIAFNGSLEDLKNTSNELVKDFLIDVI